MQNVENISGSRATNQRSPGLPRPKGLAHVSGPIGKAMPISLILGLVIFSLIACQAQDNERLVRIPASRNDEVILAPGSPKLHYLEEITAELVQRPLMEPVTAKIV